MKRCADVTATNGEYHPEPERKEDNIAKCQDDIAERHWNLNLSRFFRMRVTKASTGFFKLAGLGTDFEAVESRGCLSAKVCPPLERMKYDWPASAPTKWTCGTPVALGRLRPMA
jgi:hypothetical protein